MKNIPQTIAVAWSGGVDSTALLLALANTGRHVQAWHVDHGWHAASGEQAKALAGLAESWGIPFVHRSIAASERNREAMARQGRYQAFAELADETGVHTLCLGHHRDDQAETVCMRMLQHDGVFGLRAMQPEQVRQGLHLLRPLLHVSRRDLQKALQQQGVTWLEDASNVDASLWRNRLRHGLFPAMVSKGVDPVELYLRWQKQAVLVAGKIEDAAACVATSCERDACWLSWAGWSACEPAVRAFLLQKMMRHVLGEGQVAGRRHIVLVEAWTARGGCQGLDLSRSRLSHEQDRLYLRRRP